MHLFGNSQQHIHILLIKNISHENLQGNVNLQSLGNASKGPDKEIKALCYTLLSSGGHTCDLSHKGFPAWKSSHNKQGSADTIPLEKTLKSR